jgi:alanyl-tRNA synthetase
VPSNYHTDGFSSIFAALEELTSLDGSHWRDGRDEQAVAARVIADHVRAICFLLCDGVVPNNVGRGYTFRRVLRRAVRHGNALGLQKPFLSELIPVLSERADEWPHIAQRLGQVVPLVRQEEELFLRTMSRGLELLAAELAQIEKDVESTAKEVDSGGALKLSAETAFQLYDTYGFPFDLTATIASERGFEVDMAGAAQLMEQQRKRARAGGGVGEATKSSSNDVALPAEVSTAWQRDGIQVHFTGHGTLSESNIRVLAVEMDESSLGAWIALERSPFYPTGGGQIGDVGCLSQTLGEGNCEVIASVRPYQGAIACRVVAVGQGDMPWLPIVGEYVDATVAVDHRRGCSTHHTATHMLAAALRAVLPNENVLVQAGSEVSPRRLRYDCSGVGNTGISANALERVTELVNDAIRSGLAVRTQEMPVDEAVAKGAVADFGEKYGDTVRVVTIGDGDALTATDESWNTELEQQTRRFNNLLFAGELCGGTHVCNTSELSAFTIVKEGGVGAGTRRVEALAGEAAYDWHEARSKILGDLALTLKTPVSEVPTKVAKLLKEQKDRRKLAAQGRGKKGKATSEPQSQSGQGMAPPVRVGSGARLLVLHNCGEEAVSWQRDFATETAKTEPQATHIVVGDGHIVAR